MHNSSRAAEILGHLDQNTLRVVFLYVGQGEATFMQVPSPGGPHLSVLIDCNRSPSANSIDIAALLTDILPPSPNGSKPRLDYFINTHPHCDHIGGLDRVSEAVTVGEVWHSGHKPSAAHEGPYGNLLRLIASVTKAGGQDKEKRLIGSRNPLTLGSASVQVLSPAQYIAEEIGDLSPDERDARIHDQCAVLRFGFGSANNGVLITGDADKTAWQRIAGYYGDVNGENRVASNVLSAPHHGSHTFFKDRKDDEEPYYAVLDVIRPEHIIVSAPDQKDSKHSHPEDDAMKVFCERVGNDNVHHMGSRAFSFVVDIPQSGTYELRSDHGELAKAFPVNDGGEKTPENGGGGRAEVISSVGIISRIEKSRPMGQS